MSEKDVSVRRQKPGYVSAKWFVKRREVVVSDEGRTPPPSIRLLAVKSLSATFSLIGEQALLAIRVSTVRPAEVDIELILRFRCFAAGALLHLEKVGARSDVQRSLVTRPADPLPSDRGAATRRVRSRHVRPWGGEGGAFLRDAAIHHRPVDHRRGLDCL